MTAARDRVSDLLVRDRIGTVLGESSPTVITQEDVNTFARLTNDLQWIHVDPERAETGPYGTTIAHGYFVLSLLPQFTRDTVDFASAGTVINYGLNRVRFIGPAKINAELVDEVTLKDLTPKGDRTLVTLEHRVRDRTSDSVVCIAETLSLFDPGS